MQRWDFLCGPAFVSSFIYLSVVQLRRERYSIFAGI